MGSKMARKGKLKRWFVSMLSGVIVATTVMGTSVVAFAEEGGEQPQIEEKQDDQGNDNAPENEDKEQDTGADSEDQPAQDESEVKEDVIIHSGGDIVVITNPDSSKTVSYEDQISGMTTKERADQEYSKQVEKQEGIKADIEGQGGSYEYQVSEPKYDPLSTEKKEMFDTKDEADARAAEVSGNVGDEPEKVQSEKSITKNFLDEEAAKEYAKDLVNNNENIISAKVVKSETIQISTEQTDREGYRLVDGEWTEDSNSHDGYHIEKTGEHEYTIVITGGVDSITLDLSWVTGSFGSLWPDDRVTSGFKIINASEDDYEITDHKEKMSVFGKYVSVEEYEKDPSKYGDLIMYARVDGQKSAIYKPNVVTESDCKDLINQDYYPYFISQWKAVEDEDGNITMVPRTDKERRKWADEHAGKLTEQELIDFYDNMTGVKHDSHYDAWADFYTQYVRYIEYYMNDLDPSNDRSYFFTDQKPDLSAGKSNDFHMRYSLSGSADNFYEAIIEHGFVNTIVLSILKTQAQIDYIEEELKYIVTYDEETANFVVTVEGHGEIPAIIIPGPNPDPDPDPTPDPTPVITTPGEAPAVLGAQRELVAPEAPAVLGARRAGTSDETNMVLRLIVIAAAASVLVIARKRAHN